MTRHSRRTVAYHEAGHAVVAWRVRRAIRSISIIPDEESLGRVSQTPIDLDAALLSNDERDANKLEKEVLVLMAGEAAECALHKRRRWPKTGTSDMDAAMDIIISISGGGAVTTAYHRYLWEWAKLMVAGP